MISFGCIYKKMQVTERWTWDLTPDSNPSGDHTEIDFDHIYCCRQLNSACWKSHLVSANFPHLDCHKFRQF